MKRWSDSFAGYVSGALDGQGSWINRWASPLYAYDLTKHYQAHDGYIGPDSTGLGGAQTRAPNDIIDLEGDYTFTFKFIVPSGATKYNFEVISFQAEDEEGQSWWVGPSPGGLVLMNYWGLVADGDFEPHAIALDVEHTVVNVFHGQFLTFYLDGVILKTVWNGPTDPWYNTFPAYLNIRTEINGATLPLTQTKITAFEITQPNRTASAAGTINTVTGNADNWTSLDPASLAGSQLDAALTNDSVGSTQTIDIKFNFGLSSKAVVRRLAFTLNSHMVNSDPSGNAIARWDILDGNGATVVGDLGFLTLAAIGHNNLGGIDTTVPGTMGGAMSASGTEIDDYTLRLTTTFTGTSGFGNAAISFSSLVATATYTTPGGAAAQYANGLL